MFLETAEKSLKPSKLGIEGSCESWSSVVNHIQCKWQVSFLKFMLNL